MTRRPTPAILAGLALLAAAGVLRRALLPANVRIADPEGPPTLDAFGRARSVQAAELEIPPAALEALWSPTGLDRLGATYWRFLTRTTLGLLRVVQTPDARLIVLLARPLVLLAFGPPDQRLTPETGLISWPIRGGLLAASRPTGRRPNDDDDGVLQIQIRRLDPVPAHPATLRLAVVVLGFRPTVAERFGPAVYARTQARVHVFLTHTFMRSLARMRLAPPPG